MAKEFNQGWAAGIGQRSRVKKLAWALKGAPMRRKDLRLNAMGGIVEGRKLRDRITDLMERADAYPNDAIVLCVFAESDLSKLAPKPVQMLPVGDTSDLDLVGENSGKLPIGFLVFVLDREDPEQPIFGHARPLIVEDPRGIALNDKALSTYQRWLIKELSGEISGELNIAASADLDERGTV